LALTRPVKPGDWLDLVGPPVAGLIVGMAWAAYLAARHGVATTSRDDDPRSC
jgi:PAT family beta-lactamase induction signal transducer AmpG